MREPPKKTQLDLQKDPEAPWRSWGPPAPVDIPAYGRRAGEIIARGARALRTGPRPDRTR